jgi:hypothetical protein
MPDLWEMIGKEVEVMANGVSYRGTLVEVSDTEVHLKTLLQWVALPASSVGQIRLLQKARTAVAETIDAPEEVSDWQAIGENEQPDGS